MKKIAVLGLALILPAFAFGLDGYEVASKSYNVETGKTAFFNATLTLKTKKGATRVREISLRKKEFGDSKKTLISFSAPKDVEGVAYLSFDYTGKSASSKESESWLYMPAMKKVRRINGSSRQDDFMGYLALTRTTSSFLLKKARKALTATRLSASRRTRAKKFPAA